MHGELEKDLLRHHINHAYLLVGERETAVADARSFAMALNCLNPQEAQSCGSCRNCILAQEDSFCDFTILKAEKKAYSIGEIRNFVKIAQFAPQEGKYRIFLLTDIENMEAPAINAMLKTIEEPTDDTIVLLQTENYDKILPTITSRCHVLRYDEQITVTQEDLDKAYELLTTLPHLSIDALFTRSAQFSAKNKDALKTLLYAIEEILSRSYEALFLKNTDLTPVLDRERYGEETLFLLWEKALKALEHLSFQGNPRLIADTYFLAVKKANGGI